MYNYIHICITICIYIYIYIHIQIWRYMCMDTVFRVCKHVQTHVVSNDTGAWIQYFVCVNMYKHVVYNEQYVQIIDHQVKCNT